MPELCPLRFEARLLPKIWGGRGLGRWGKTLPDGADIGESWELYDDAQGSSVCSQGPAAGHTLAELARDWGAAFYGPGRGAVHGRFPLLVKLLDAREGLSVQVHPSDEVARRLHGPDAVGKSEMWVVLEAAPGARVLNGFKSGATWAGFQAAQAEGSVAELLHAVPVRAGDVIDVPAGRPHAIGAGCLIAEVQQNSDRTYRLWDYGRLEQGRPRALHLAEAEQALRFDALGCGKGLITPLAVAQAWGFREELVSNAHFSVERWTLKPGAQAAVAGRLRVLLPLAGKLRLAWAGDAVGLPWAPGATTLAPAALSMGLHAGAEGATLLCVEAR